MDPMTLTPPLLLANWMVSLWLVAGSGRSHRSRHVRPPIRLWMGIFLSLAGLHISLVALAIVLGSKRIEGDPGLLVLLAFFYLITFFLNVVGPQTHVRSGFRPVRVTLTFAPGNGVDRGSVLLQARDRLRTVGFRVLTRHPWPCDLVAISRRTFRCNTIQFWNLTEAAGELEVQVLIDVADYIVTDTSESVNVGKVADQVVALFEHPPFSRRLLEKRVARLPGTRLLLGPGPELVTAARSGGGRAGWLEHLARYLLHYKITTPGKFIVGGMIASITIGATSLRIPVYHLVTAIFGLVACAWFAGLLLRPRLTVHGTLPPRTGAGQPVSAEFTLTNRSLVPAFDVSTGYFHLPPSLRDNRDETWISVIPPRQSASLSVRVDPVKRGLYTLPDLTAYSTFPFHLFRSSATRKRSGNLLVLPSFHPLVSIDVPIGRRYQPGGIALTSSVGESPEYIGNREYRDGDPIRRLDWKSWARLSRPAVREFQEEYYCRVALVLDTFVPAERTEKREGFPDLEAAVSLTAAVADALSRGEFLIDIFAAGPELHVFRAGRHLAHFENVLEILACLEACRHNPFDIVAPALSEQLGNISTVVCLFLDWDDSREKLVRAAAEAGCAVKLVIVRDTDTTGSIGQAEDWCESVVHLTPDVIRNGEVETL